MNWLYELTKNFCEIAGLFGSSKVRNKYSYKIRDHDDDDSDEDIFPDDTPYFFPMDVGDFPAQGE